MALVATGGTAAGGLTLLSVKKLQASNVAKKCPLQIGHQYPSSKEKSA
jgi:hypothetical protein